MQEEKDFIEINLNLSNVSSNGKGLNYFGNIQFAKIHDSSLGGFPYGQYYNEDEINSKSTIYKDKNKLYGLNFIEADQRPNKLSCLRQMYCQDCQQRLDEDSLLMDGWKQGLCCVPIFSINRFYRKCLKRYGNRKIYCKNCGGHMGYWKQA